MAKDLKEASLSVEVSKSFIEKMMAGAMPLKWISFHTGIGFPGAMPPTTTFTQEKAKACTMHFHPQSSLILIGAKGRFYMVHSSNAKGMELDLSK